MEKFIGNMLKGVEVEEGGVPKAFHWDGKEYCIEKIIKKWHNFDYSPLSPKKNWRSRRHRNYYRVITETGEYFEMYCDRGTRLGAPKVWVLLRELEQERTDTEKKILS